MTLLAPHAPAPAGPALAESERLIPRGVVHLLAAGAACAVWAAAVWAAPHVHADPLLHRVALFAHLACLLVGFGAVLTVDWIGALWLMGRRSLGDVLSTAGAVHAPIWGGLVGLTASGVFLHPDTGSTLTRVKLCLVLLVALNGVHAMALHRRLLGHRASRPLLARCAASVLLSQAGWWGATGIGFLNSSA
ncbi:MULTISPECIES: hypothetical protein [Streptomyces]|uniref:Uncharacterized protein n=1 Tax=Streptomyces griseocarneus TaxID=51201 RepID=A0ABX7RKJ7_9ACTN|nr:MULTISPECIES: hypothetical protein [Streptomyces]QSY48786.1 hypothetical protein J3S04_27745 [Streptomyces griseocarneus]